MASEAASHAVEQAAGLLRLDGVAGLDEKGQRPAIKGQGCLPAALPPVEISQVAAIVRQAAAALQGFVHLQGLQKKGFRARRIVQQGVRQAKVPQCVGDPGGAFERQIKFPRLLQRPPRRPRQPQTQVGCPDSAQGSGGHLRVLELARDLQRLQQKGFDRF